ncbi:hypothetical protein ECANGB1_58 [Enterospora canceri]|uniref:Uncharacterized protein n=1 Tax=Enterospora canceri TaxID=1081671 RepID=A0A1Y1S8E5_9MICR|nr:hypothetical protein ECANGB1_58 [Enterospora canceri]
MEVAKNLHNLIVERRDDTKWLISIVKFCDYGTLTCLLNSTNRSKDREEIHREILNVFKCIKLVKKNSKYKIKPIKCFIRSEEVEDDLSKHIRQINSKGMKLTKLNLSDIMECIESGKLTEVGCRNILSDYKNREYASAIFRMYQNSEYIRCALFDTNDFNNWLSKNQYIYLEANQTVVIDRIKKAGVSGKNEIKIKIDRMLQSNNEARRHFGMILAQHFDYMDLIIKNRLHEDTNRTIRNKIRRISLTESICNKKKPIKRTISEILEVSQTKEKLFNTPEYLDMLESVNDKELMNIKNELREKYFEPHSLTLKSDIDNYDWTIIKKTIGIFNRLNLINESLTILVNCNYWGITTHVKEIFKNIDLSKNNLNLIEIIRSLNKNCRKSGGLSAFFGLINVDVDYIINIYINSDEVHIKFHCLNILSTLLKTKQLGLFDLDFILLMDDLPNYSEFLAEKDISKQQLLLNELQPIEQTKKNTLGSIAVYDSKITVIRSVALYLSIAFDAMKHSHFSVINCGIALYAILLQKIEQSTWPNDLYLDEYSRDLIYEHRNNLKIFVVKIYSVLINLTEREKDFLVEASKEQSYEGVATKELLRKTNIVPGRRIVFKNNVPKYRIFYHLLNILNQYNDSEVECAFDYIKNELDIDIRYQEEARIKICNKAKEELDKDEIEALIRLLEQCDAIEMRDFAYDIDLLKMP